jgi:molybdopterin molybdotransferase
MASSFRKGFTCRRPFHSDGGIVLIDRKSRFARKAIKADEARRLVLQHIQPISTHEELALEACLDRRLAQDIYAPENVPHFRRSGLDGYAVRSKDASNCDHTRPAALRIVGESAAGCESPPAVEQGTAVRIMTGALVPECADAVVMFEQTDEFEQDGVCYVRVKHAVTSGQNVALPGEDIAKDRLIIPAGSRIGPGQIALLAAFGLARVRVNRIPKVGILTTGSELLAVHESLVPGKVRNSNAYMLHAQITAAGGEARWCGSVPDHPEEARRAIDRALDECDAVITTGGVSVGDYDVMAEWFREHGEWVLFNKVAMRPGSPTTAAVIRGKPIFGLSGNPAACFVGFELFVKPALLAMTGASQAAPLLSEAILEEDYPKASPHDRYERAKLSFRSGRVTVHPLGQNKSSMMLSLQHADCLMVIPSGSSGAFKGDTVRVIPLGYETSWMAAEERREGDEA